MVRSESKRSPRNVLLHLKKFTRQKDGRQMQVSKALSLTQSVVFQTIGPLYSETL